MASALGFLLSQVGAHSSVRFGESLEPLGLKPAHAGILRAIEQSDGVSQQTLCERLGVFSSRLVGLIDELERQKLVERRNNPNDRRSYALYLTKSGREILQQIGKIGRQHQDAICAALSESERTMLCDFLARIAAEQGLAPGIHPGFKTMKDSD
jgi:DNA-binding MarR family transcriptional regulator